MVDYHKGKRIRYTTRSRFLAAGKKFLDRHASKRLPGKNIGPAVVEYEAVLYGLRYCKSLLPKNSVLIMTDQESVVDSLLVMLSCKKLKSMSGLDCRTRLAVTTNALQNS